MADTEKPDLDDLLADMDDTLNDLQDKVQRLKEAMEDADDADPNIRPILQARLSVDTAYAAEATIFCLSLQDARRSGLDGAEIANKAQPRFVFANWPTEGLPRRTIPYPRS